MMNFPRSSAMISQYESWTAVDGPSTSTFPPPRPLRNKCNDSMNLNTEPKYYFYGWPIVVPMSTILILAILVTVFGNILVILTIWRHRGMRTRTNLFLANLALADILVGVLDMPFSVATLVYGDWNFGDVFCQFNAFTNGLGLMTSTHTLMLISIHKYISITRPFSHIMSTRVISVMIAAAWLWSTIYNLAPLYGWTSVAYKKGATQCGPVMPCTKIERSHSYCNTLINLVTPIVVMIFCNVRIFRAVGQHLTRMRQTSNMDFRNTVLQQRRITVTLVIVIVCFFLCWTPYTVYSCMIALSENHEWVPSILNPISYWCGYINSACNPIIYAFRSPSFRQGYKEILFGHTSEVSTGSFYSGSMTKPTRPYSHLNKGRYFKKQKSKASFKGYTNSYTGRARPEKPRLLHRESSAPAIFVDVPDKIPKPNGKSNGAIQKKKVQSSPDILFIKQQDTNGESDSKQMLQIGDSTRKQWRSIEIENYSKDRNTMHGSLEEIHSIYKRKSNPDQKEECLVTQFNGCLNPDEMKSNENFQHQELPSVTITNTDTSTDIIADEEKPDDLLSTNDASNLEAMSLALGGSLEKLHRQITRRRLRKHHGDNTKETDGESRDLKLLHADDDTLSTKSSKSLRASLYNLFRKSTNVLTGQTKSTEDLQIPNNPNTNE